MFLLHIVFSGILNCNAFSVAPSTYNDNINIKYKNKLTYRGQLWKGKQNMI